MGDPHLTIGELAKRTGVATSALRYYEELGLLPAPDRVSGQRRYPESAVGLVGLILLLQDVGFSLRESKALLASRTQAVEGWRSLAQRKLTDLDEQIANAQTAKEVITHGLACPHDDFTTSPTPPASSPPASPANPCRKPTHTDLVSHDSLGGGYCGSGPTAVTLGPPSAAFSLPRDPVAHRIRNRAARTPTAGGRSGGGRCRCARTADGRKPPGRPERS